MGFSLARKLTRSMIVGGVLAFSCLSASAATFDFTFNAHVDTSIYPYELDTVGGEHYQVWGWYRLSPFGDPGTTIRLGDTINASVLLDTPMTFSAAGSRKLLFSVDLVEVYATPGPDFYASKTSGAFTVLSAGVPILSGAVDCTMMSGGSDGPVAGCFSMSAPHSAEISFDAVQTTFTIDSLNTPGSAVTVNLVTFTAMSVTPVPEPETHAFMLAGLGVIGTFVRRRLRRD